MDDLEPLRASLCTRCREWGLKGTIILSTEGINVSVAGGTAQIDLFLRFLRGIPGLDGLMPKDSESGDQPFGRMKVKIKKEIIALGVAGIDPAQNPAPRVSARELKKWLDEGRPVTLLDARNDFEVSLGTFRAPCRSAFNTFESSPPRQ